MKRTPFVVGASAAGLAALLAFHTSPATVSLGLIPGAPARSLLGHSSGGNVLPESGSAQRFGSGSTRAAVGPAVNYNYGVLSVRVTVSGHRLVKIAIATLRDAALSRSQLIDHQSIPILESEALKAQSANIQGVSGASYTSAGFAQSLQGALHALGLT